MEKYQGFDKGLLKAIRSKFEFVDSDPYIGPRIFFENAGGSLRLKSVIESVVKDIGVPDAQSRPNPSAKHLSEIYNQGIESTRVLLGAQNGVIFSEQTASRALFSINSAIISSTSGKNVVTTSLEHPGSYDSLAANAIRTGKELRTAPADKNDGCIRVEEILKLIDKETSLLCFTYASNITGAVLDASEIIREARRIKPEIFIVIDATQHVPHGLIDIDVLGGIDGLVFAPYKAFGKRGIGIGYVSDRTAQLDHDHILAKGSLTWELGSPDPLAFATMKDVVEHISWIGSHFSASANARDLIVEGMNAIRQQELSLLQRMIDGSDEIPGMRSIKNAKVNFIPEDIENRDCIVALSFDNVDSESAVKLYAERGIIVFDRKVSNVMSKRCLEALGVDSIVRVSPLHCHSFEDVDVFLKATAEIARI